MRAEMVYPGRTLGEVAAVTSVQPEFAPKIVEKKLHSHVNDTTTNTIFGGNSCATRVTLQRPFQVKCAQDLPSLL